MRTLVPVWLFAAMIGCGGSTTDEGGGSGGAGGSATGGAGGTSSGGAATGGSAGMATGGMGTGGMGTGGMGMGGMGTGGMGTGGMGTGGATAGVCASVCQEMAAAQCPNEESYAECSAGCQVDWPGFQAKCGPEIDAYAKCVTGPGLVVCNPDGEAKAQGCEAELAAFATCGGCLPNTEDDACAACGKTSCCAELTAFYAHPQYLPYLKCVNACTTHSCVSACWSQSSGLDAPLQALAACEGAHCPAC